MALGRFGLVGGVGPVKLPERGTKPMKIRLFSPALRRRYGGEVVEIEDHQAQAYVNAGVAMELKPKPKKTTESKAKKKAETTAK